MVIRAPFGRALWLGVLAAGLVSQAALADPNPHFLIHTWSLGLGSFTTQVVDVAPLADGGAAVTGWFIGAVNFGDGLLTSAGSSDIFVLRLDAGGGLVWSRSCGGISPDRGNAIAATDDGGIVIAGEFGDTVDFGGGPVASVGSQNAFVLKFDGSGAYQWSRTYGGGADNFDAAVGVSVAPDGGILVAGRFTGTTDFGDGSVSTAQVAGFALELLANGSDSWSRAFISDFTASGEDIAALPGGGAIVSGHFFGTLNFGGGPLTTADTTELFVVRLDDGGEHQWSRACGGPLSSGVFARSVAVAPNEQVFVSGIFRGTADFGGGGLTSAGGDDGFLVALSGADGSHVFSRRFGNEFDDFGFEMGVTPAGTAILAVAGIGSLDFGTGPIAAPGFQTLFVVEVDGAGLTRLARVFGGASTSIISGDAVAVSATRHILVGGRVVGIVIFDENFVSGGMGQPYVVDLRLLLPESAILDVTDVLEDQGRAARVRFSGSDLEFATPYSVGYFVWGRVDAAAAATSSREVAWHDLETAPKVGTRILVGPGATTLSLPPGLWEVLGSAPGIRQAEYVVRVPTSGDSTDAGIDWTAYVVTSHISGIGWFASDPDSGYSVDNLVPSAPPSLVSQILAGPAIRLAWTASHDSDVRYYGIYRGTVSNFVPAAANRIGATVSMSFVDGAPQGAMFYKVAASDFAGNIGVPATTFLDLTGIADFAPGSLALALAGPNPVRTEAALWVGIPASGPAALEVYGLDGRRVRSLLGGVSDPGLRLVSWNLADESGRRVAPGAYIVRLKAGGAAVTKKLVVVR